MTLIPRFFDDENVVDKYEGKVAADKALTVRDRVVYVDADSATGAVTITLPNVSEAIGMVFVIYAETSTSNDITIQDAKDEAGLTDITLDAADEYSVLFSDGKHWYEIASNHA